MDQLIAESPDGPDPAWYTPRSGEQYDCAPSVIDRVPKSPRNHSSDEVKRKRTSLQVQQKEESARHIAEIGPKIEALVQTGMKVRAAVVLLGINPGTGDRWYRAWKDQHMEALSHDYANQ